MCFYQSYAEFFKVNSMTGLTKATDIIDPLTNPPYLWQSCNRNENWLYQSESTGRHACTPASRRKRNVILECYLIFIKYPRHQCPVYLQNFSYSTDLHVGISAFEKLQISSAAQTMNKKVKAVWVTLTIHQQNKNSFTLSAVFSQCILHIHFNNYAINELWILHVAK